MAVKGNYVYGVASFGESLVIVDASNPSNLNPISNLRFGDAYGIAVKDNYAYIGMIGSAYWNNNLRVFDISNPENPTQISQTSLTHPPSGAEFSWA